MTVRTFALLYGIVFLLVGILGFVPGVTSPHEASDPATVMDHGRLLGLFPVNTLHNIVHAVFGIWGIAVYRSAGGAVAYARAVAIIYAVLTVMGLVPGLDTVFGLVPLYSHDVWLHLVLAAVAAYFGFVRPRETVAPAVHRA
jgi:hypothetical protein